MAAQMKSNREFAAAIADVAAQHGQRMGQLISNALQSNPSIADDALGALFYMRDEQLLELVKAYARKTK